MPAGRLFDLVIIVDWSAASTPGPPRPSADRCWIAWGRAEIRPPPEYFRTRRATEQRIAALLAANDGPALVGFDFPFGYPHGSGLGGGPKLAARLARLIEDRADGSNNRFAVAAELNREIGAPPGPFWGCPARLASPELTARKPNLTGRPFRERRRAEQFLQQRQIMTTWQLLGRGAVGGQVLLGLPALHRLSQHPKFGRQARIWPFQTGWDQGLEGTVLAEIWPSLCDHPPQPYPIKDARQVAATRDWVLRADAAGELREAFAAPTHLNAAEIDICQHEEGWIVGAELALARGKLA